MTVLEWLLASVVTLFGAILQGSIGFGLGLLGVPLLVLVNPDFVPGPLLLAALILNLFISGRERKSIDTLRLKWAILGRAFGTGLGAGLLLIFPRDNLSLLFGSMVLLAVMISIAGVDFSLSPCNLFGAGTFSGFMGTTSAIGGPPVALVYQRKTGPQLRGTLAAIFIFGTVLSLFTLMLIRRFGWQELLAGISLLPGVLLGFAFSSATAKVLDRGFTRPAVLIASAVSAAAVILKSLF